MFELLNQLLMDTSAIYIYIGIVLTFVCVYHGFALSAGNLRQHNESFIQRWHQREFSLLPDSDQLMAQKEVKQWIQHKQKRLTVRDDDSEPHSIRAIFKLKKMLGGQQWRENLYSLNLQSIVSSQLSY